MVLSSISLDFHVLMNRNAKKHNIMIMICTTSYFAGIQPFTILSHTATKCPLSIYVIKTVSFIGTHSRGRITWRMSTGKTRMMDMGFRTFSISAGARTSWSKSKGGSCGWYTGHHSDGKSLCSRLPPAWYYLSGWLLVCGQLASSGIPGPLLEDSGACNIGECTKEYRKLELLCISSDTNIIFIKCHMFLLLLYFWRLESYTHPFLQLISILPFPSCF